MGVLASVARAKVERCSHKCKWASDARKGVTRGRERGRARNGLDAGSARRAMRRVDDSSRQPCGVLSKLHAHAHARARAHAHAHAHAHARAHARAEVQGTDSHVSAMPPRSRVRVCILEQGVLFRVYGVHVPRCSRLPLLWHAVLCRVRLCALVLSGSALASLSLSLSLRLC